MDNLVAVREVPNWRLGSSGWTRIKNHPVNRSATDAVPGENWSSEVGDALAQSDVLVVLVSPAAMQSKWVRREILYALGEERFEDRVIPVLVKRTPRSEIPWSLNALQWLEGEPEQVAASLVKSFKAPARAEAR